jgi:DNA-directed RNA polymerase II subunit RPB1
MDQSPLKRSTFEEVVEVFNQAACYKEKDDLNGISECIVMGIPPKMGTQLTSVFTDETVIERFKKNPPTINEQMDQMFEDNESWIQMDEPDVLTMTGLQSKKEWDQANQVANNINDYINPFVGGGENFGMPSQFGMIQQPQFGMIQQPQFGMIQQPQFGMIQQPQFGMIQQPQFGMIQQPQIGMIQQPQIGMIQQPLQPQIGMSQMHTPSNQVGIKRKIDSPMSPAYSPMSPAYSPMSPTYSPKSPTYDPEKPASPMSPAYNPNCMPKSPDYDPDMPPSPMSPAYSPRGKVYDPTSPDFSPGCPQYTPSSLIPDGYVPPLDLGDPMVPLSHQQKQTHTSQSRKTFF